MDTVQPVIECKNISKTFPGVRALDQVNFQLYPGEIHGLVGENGAGKSTLMKIIAGVYPHDESKSHIDENSTGMFLLGKRVVFKSPNDAIKAKIMTIHQEINVIPDLTVYENIFLNNENTRLSFLERKKMIEETRKLLDDFHAEMKPTDMVKDLSVDKMKLVEVLRAISQEAKVLIMDEPTSVLTEMETEHLFKVIKNIAQNNIGIVFISHNLSEVISLCHRITVLRDGKVVCTSDKNDLDVDKLVTSMVGKRLSDVLDQKTSYKGGTILLCVEQLNFRNVLKDINFEVHQGEILGITGLVGSGGTELAKTLFGAEGYKKDSGKIYIKGKEVRIENPKKAINAKLALLTEDRKKEGLFLKFRLYENITIPSLDKFLNVFRLINRTKQIKASANYIGLLSIKAPSSEVITESLSGGNQQKVVISKWLETDPMVLIMDEPTVGIDVAAKFEIRKIIRQLAKEGKSVILITNECNELENLCDRVLVMFKGQIIKELNSQEINEEVIMKYALGGLK